MEVVLCLLQINGFLLHNTHTKLTSLNDDLNPENIKPISVCFCWLVLWKCLCQDTRDGSICGLNIYDLKLKLQHLKLLLFFQTDHLKNIWQILQQRLCSRHCARKLCYNIKNRQGLWETTLTEGTSVPKDHRRLQTPQFDLFLHTVQRTTDIFSLEAETLLRPHCTDGPTISLFKTFGYVNKWSKLMIYSKGNITLNIPSVVQTVKTQVLKKKRKDISNNVCTSSWLILRFGSTKNSM